MRIREIQYFVENPLSYQTRIVRYNNWVKYIDALHNGEAGISDGGLQTLEIDQSPYNPIVDKYIRGTFYLKYPVKNKNLIRHIAYPIGD